MRSAPSASTSSSTAAPATPWPTTAYVSPAKNGWRRLNIGAGGYVTGIDIAPDGTKVARCDSSGAYIWRDERWAPLLTTSSMPAGHWGRDADGAGGVFEIAIAPSRPATIYACVGGRVFRTDDAGASFSLTALPQIYAISSSSNAWRMFGRLMAVDPADPLIVVVGAQAGASSITRDGGKTWSALPTPAPVSQSGVRVAFDPKTRRLYVHSDGAGVFASDDHGGSFAPLAGGPAAARHMAVDRAGVLWITDTAGALWSHRAGSWSQALGPSDLKTIAIDPVRAGHLVVGTAGGSLHRSFDGGATWTGSSGVPTRRAEDIPWLAWTNESYMSSGDMRFDADGSLWFAEGIGVWRAALAGESDAVVFESRSRGIEQMTSNTFLIPPGGAPLYLAWDRPVFRLGDLTRFPAKHGPSARTSIVMGWSADYAPEDPSFVVALINWNGVELTSSSSDGGESWTQLPSVPDELKAGKIGGAIAVASRTNYVIAPSNNGTPWVTADGGRSWARCVMPGAPPPGGETGWGTAYYFHRHIVVADKAMPGAFYAYNYRTGWYRSIDAGATWALAHPAFEGGQWTAFHARVAAVPGHAGHLFFTPGTQQGAGQSPVMFQRSRDGGATWTRVDRFWEVHAFGFGAPAPGATYPAIYAAGFLDDRFGLYRSDDDAKHWIALGDYPLDIGDEITWVAGDPDHYGRVYVAFGGSGAVYREL